MYKSGLVELEAVVAIARHGSFRAAASDLDMSPTAIGNAVASLEKRLGVRLFNRTTRNVALTSAGREYVEAIAPALSDIRNAAQAVADHRRKPTGTLRFSCSLGGGRRLLMPLVIEYRRRYGDMKVEIVTEGRLIDIIKKGYDAGVRLAEAVPRDMIAIPLGPHTRHVVVGAPSYFANRPRPIAPADLMAHECIRTRYPSGALYRWEFERRGEAMRIDVSLKRVDARVSRTLPLLFRTPPHGCELARLHRSGPEDCLSESREGVLMDVGRMTSTLDGHIQLDQP